MQADIQQIFTWASAIVVAVGGAALGMQKLLRVYTNNNTNLNVAKAEGDLLARMHSDLDRMAAEHSKLNIALIASNDQLRLVNAKLAHLELTVMRLYNLLAFHEIEIPEEVSDHVQTIQNQTLYGGVERRAAPRPPKDAEPKHHQHTHHDAPSDQTEDGPT